MVYPLTPTWHQCNVTIVTTSSRTDYCANNGTTYFNGSGPAFNTSTYTAPCFTLYPNCTDWSWTPNYLAQCFNGVSGPQSEVERFPTARATSFLREKNTSIPTCYYNGEDRADNDTCWKAKTGTSTAVCRYPPCATRRA